MASSPAPEDIPAFLTEGTENPSGATTTPGAPRQPNRPFTPRSTAPDADPRTGKTGRAIDGVLDSLLAYRRRHAREEWNAIYITLLVDEALAPATLESDRLAILHEIRAILAPPQATPEAAV